MFQRVTACDTVGICCVYMLQLTCMITSHKISAGGYQRRYKRNWTAGMPCLCMCQSCSDAIIHHSYSCTRAQPSCCWSQNKSLLCKYHHTSQQLSYHQMWQLLLYNHISHLLLHLSKMHASECLDHIAIILLAHFRSHTRVNHVHNPTTKQPIVSNQ